MGLQMLNSIMSLTPLCSAWLDAVNRLMYTIDSRENTVEEI